MDNCLFHHGSQNILSLPNQILFPASPCTAPRAQVICFLHHHSPSRTKVERDVISFKLKILVAFPNDGEEATVGGTHQQGNNPTACAPNTTAGKLWLSQQYQKCRAQHWFPVREEEISLPSPSPSPHQDNQHRAK